MLVCIDILMFEKNQRGNPTLYFEEGHIIQWPIQKVQKGKGKFEGTKGVIRSCKMVDKILQKKQLKIEQHKLRY